MIPHTRFARAARTVVVAVSLIVGGEGCSVTNGSGEMHGSLNVPACTFSKLNPISLKNEASYSLGVDFFAGEPFDSTTPRFPANQLNIRMESSSSRPEFADALNFWVLDSYEVGRCIRGRTNPDGTPDWNEAYCDRSPGAIGPSGEGRVLVGIENEIVSSAFALYYTCPDLSAAVALGSCAGGTCPDLTFCPGRGSWISFAQFGSVTAGGGQGILGRDFKVNDGETIRSSAFHVALCDKSTVDKTILGRLPIPTPQITGTLDGSFQFHMDPRFR
jgi:hypothetical protein